MTEWRRNKVLSENINKGNEFTTDDDLTIEELNAMVNSGLYSQDFAEKLVTNIDTSDIGNVGIPSVSLVAGDGATDDKPYKKFKFSNLKGEQGIQGEKGDNGEKGDKGDPNTLSIGSVSGGTTASATITGTAPNQTLNLVLPKGDKGDTGDKGDKGDAGIPNTLTIGTVETLATGENATATITGTSPNQVLNLGLPRGEKGDVGSFSDGSVELLAAPYTSKLAEMSRNTPSDDNYMFGSNFNHITYDTVSIPSANFNTTSYTYAKKLVVDFDVYIDTKSSIKSAYPKNYKVELIQAYKFTSTMYHYYSANIIYDPYNTPTGLFNIPAHTSGGFTGTGTCVRIRVMLEDGLSGSLDFYVYGICAKTNATVANRSYCSIKINSIKAYY